MLWNDSLSFYFLLLPVPGMIQCAYYQTVAKVVGEVIGLQGCFSGHLNVPCKNNCITTCVILHIQPIPEIFLVALNSDYHKYTESVPFTHVGFCFPRSENFHIVVLSLQPWHFLKISGTQKLMDIPKFRSFCCRY